MWKITKNFDEKIISDAEADVVNVMNDMKFDMKAAIDWVIAVLSQSRPGRRLSAAAKQAILV